MLRCRTGKLQFTWALKLRLKKQQQKTRENFYVAIFLSRAIIDGIVAAILIVFVVTVH